MLFFSLQRPDVRFMRPCGLHEVQTNDMSWLINTHTLVGVL